MNKLLLTVSVCLAIAGQASGQNIKGHYVAKTETDGTIYHTFPSTLFESRGVGDLIFDITYKSNPDKQAAINFTYEMDAICPIDSVCFACGPIQISGRADKIYVSPEKKTWKHRYTVSADVDALYVFFDAQGHPAVTLYSQGKPYLYSVKSSAWKNYAPIGHKIFEMIRLNELH